MYQIGDKVRIRRLKDMQCEFEAPPPQYYGNALILGNTCFVKGMIAYCEKEFFIKDIYFCNRNIYGLETNYGEELPFNFGEYMFERCGKNVREYTEEDLEELDNQIFI